MIPISPALRVYLAPGVTDMRKSFNGLAAAVRDVLEEDPLSGCVFAFANRRRNLVKLLLWDGTGLWVLGKRLERGTFAWPKVEPGQTKVVLSPSELSALLGGFALDRATRRRGWWKREPGLAPAPRPSQIGV